MEETHIRIDLIKWIEFLPKKSADIIWMEAEPAKKFLFIFTWDETKEAGWMKDYDSYRYTTEDLLSWDNLMFDGKEWFKRAYVRVVLPDGSFRRYFDSDEEAKAWIRELENANGKKFEIITD